MVWYLPAQRSVNMAMAVPLPPVMEHMGGHTIPVYCTDGDPPL